MTSFDYVVLTIIGVSVVLSMMRGFVREVIAILSWVGAFYVAKNYSLQIL
ncbi:MAG: CvpA family protein, partial [Methylotenera sp.]|nr:CvpA family protein [Methylotenera sp.]